MLILLPTLHWAARYLTVAITFVRLMAVTDPFTFANQITPRRAIVSIFLIYIAVACGSLGVQIVSAPSKS